jgi:glycine cleavage system aminomethyltransferase T
LKDGKGIGYVTSSNYGYSIGKQIAYGYLPVEYAKKGTQVEIEYFGKRLTAAVSDDPQYDPKMEKIKA